MIVELDVESTEILCILDCSEANLLDRVIANFDTINTPPLSFDQDAQNKEESDTHLKFACVMRVKNENSASGEISTENNDGVQKKIDRAKKRSGIVSDTDDVFQIPTVMEGDIASAVYVNTTKASFTDNPLSLSAEGTSMNYSENEACVSLDRTLPSSDINNCNELPCDRFPAPKQDDTSSTLNISHDELTAVKSKASVEVHGVQSKFMYFKKNVPRVPAAYDVKKNEGVSRKLKSNRTTLMRKLSTKRSKTSVSESCATPPPTPSSQRTIRSMSYVKGSLWIGTSMGEIVVVNVLDDNSHGLVHGRVIAVLRDSESSSALPVDRLINVNDRSIVAIHCCRGVAGEGDRDSLTAVYKETNPLRRFKKGGDGTFRKNTDSSRLVFWSAVGLDELMQHQESWSSLE